MPALPVAAWSTEGFCVASRWQVPLAGPWGAPVGVIILQLSSLSRFQRLSHGDARRVRRVKGARRGNKPMRSYTAFRWGEGSGSLGEAVAAPGLVSHLQTKSQAGDLVRELIWEERGTSGCHRNNQLR